MSYILEALKKAQAERQLGSAPTIHAPQVVPAAASATTAGRRPLLIGLGAGALVVAAGALFVWRQAPAPAPQAAAPRAPLAEPARAPDGLAVSAPPVPARAPATARAAGPAAEPAVAAAPPAPVRPAAAPRAVPPPPVPAASAPVASPAPAPSAPVATRVSAPEDGLPYLQQLPDAQQRDIPRVTFGGYMYSSNPADRLLLVDKALRHEGEEVAPGLVLEKLLPKAAVMNYRGTRYRVAY
jgi:general secretion pathway protein B